MVKPVRGAKPVLGISIGDPAGIGPEITVKALDCKEIYKKSIPIVYSDRIVLEDALNITGKNFKLNLIKEAKEALGRPGTIDYIESGSISKKDDYSYGKIGKKSGDAAFQYILKALKDALAGEIAAVVTCPINKEAINMAGHKFAGHTEIFAKYTKTKNYSMLLSAGDKKTSLLNVIHVSTHVSLQKASELISKEKILKTIHLADYALKLMGKKKRRIAVAGLNPHASENGLFGNEEKLSIIPAVEKAKVQGLDVSGPIPPDTVFVRALGGHFDIVVAMYHDQGHIPLKIIGFALVNGSFRHMKGINATIGLPIIRTSVDHGTAFDIAGKNKSNEGSLLDALEMAISFAKNWDKVHKLH